MAIMSLANGGDYPVFYPLNGLFVPLLLPAGPDYHAVLPFFFFLPCRQSFYA